jgi:hypothetical protein
MSDIVKQIKDAETSKRRALASLHAELGYESPQALAAAILSASGGARPTAAANGAPVRKAAPAPAAAKPSAFKPGNAKQGKGKRLSPETRAEIISALQGGMKGTEVTRRFSISYPTVHAIKSSLGLVASRGGVKSSKQRMNRR